MFAKPGADVAFACLLAGVLVSFDQIFPVLPDGIGEVRVAVKGRVLRPANGEKCQPADRKCFDQRFLEPLTKLLRLRERPPAVAEDVPELMSELIGKLAPVTGTYVDNDPRCLVVIVMKPYR